MARKKYLDERNEDSNNHPSHPLHLKGQKHGTLQMHQGQGGGTKTRKSQDKLGDDSFVEVKKQLAVHSLTIREMPGDGNCLFRALSDQLSGTSRNHLEYRRAVVQYMKNYRPDFEPFVEDDVPFDKYVNSLAQPGTFAGNDAIVAFARLHNVSVVIHQLNSKLWVIHPSNDQDQCNGREVHIAYHNGDHYNSVRQLGDDSENPTNIKLLHQGSPGPKSGKKSPSKDRSESNSSNCSATTYESFNSCMAMAYGGRDEDYWVKDNADVERLVEEVMLQTDYPDPVFVRENLLEFNFDMAATVDFILSMSIAMSQQPNVEKSGSSTTDRNTSIDQSSSATSEIRSTPSKLYSPKKQVTDMDEQCEDVGESEESNSNESDENPNSPTPEPESSQSKPSCSRKEVRISGRRKKEQKKRERKREADLRKKRNGNSEGESVVVVSNFGSLDI